MDKIKDFYQKYGILVSILCLFIGGALGKAFFAKTTEKEVVKEVIKEVKTTDESHNSSNSNTEVKQTTGTKTTTTTVFDDKGQKSSETVIKEEPTNTEIKNSTKQTSDVKHETVEKEIIKEVTKEIITPLPNWGISLGVQYSAEDLALQNWSKPKIGGAVSYRLFQGIWIETTSSFNIQEMKKTQVGIGVRYEF